MGKIVIASGLGAANAGGTISARLPDGRVVQAKAGAAISTSKVVVMEDDSGQFHAFPEAPNTSAVTTRQIYRSKRKPAPALILDDYFFKVLQSSSIEGFDADINLDLTGYTPVGIVNTGGDDYVAILQSGLTYKFIKNGAVQTKTIQSSDFLYNFVPYFGYKGYDAFMASEEEAPYEVILTSVAGFNVLPLSRFTITSHLFSGNPLGNYNNYFDEDGSFVWNSEFRYNTTPVISRTVSTTYQKYVEFGLFTLSMGFWSDFYDFSAVTSGKFVYGYYKLDGSGLLTQRYDIPFSLSTTTQKSLTDLDYGVRVLANWSDIYSLNIGPVTFVGDYAHISHPFYWEQTGSGTILTEREHTNTGLNTENVEYNEYGGYEKRDPRLLIECDGGAVYHYFSQKNTKSRVGSSGYASPGTIPFTTVVLAIANEIPANLQLCHKVGGSVYTIKDFDLNQFNFNNRFYIVVPRQTVNLIGGAYLVGNPTVYIGVHPDNVPNDTTRQKTVTQTGSYPVKSVFVSYPENIIENIEYFDVILPDFESIDCYIYSCSNGIARRATVQVDAITVASSISFTVLDDVDVGGFFMWNTYLDNTYWMIVPKNDHTSSIAEFLRKYFGLQNVNLRLVSAEGGGQTIELAVSQAPDTTDEQDEWRADIYRFNTATLKWERRPNAVSPLSQLSAVSSHISYHPDPSG